MQDPIHCFAERAYDDAGMWCGFFDYTRICRPARTNQASARSEVFRRANILRRITDDKTVCRCKLMFDYCAIVKKGIRFLARTRVGEAMRAYIGADQDSALHLKTACEAREPGLELR